MPMWSHEESIVVNAAPHLVWARFRDVAGWTRWNDGIERIELHGTFAEGTSFTMKPPGQDALTSRLIRVIPDREFVDETVVGPVRVVVSHRLSELPDRRCRVSYRTEVTGPEADDVGRMVTSDFPQVLAALKAIVERNERA
jgi:hypothetical protein